MKNMGRFVLLFVVLFVLLSVPAFAADVTLFGGMQHEGKLTLNCSNCGSVTQVLKNPFNSGVVGIRVGSGGALGHEETLAFAPNFIDSKSKAVILNSNILLSIPTPVVKPYVTAGLGAVVVSGSGPSDIGTKLAINYGGGVKLKLAGPLGLRGDVRGYTLTRVQGQRLNMIEASLGVFFHF
jgi:opacity protein-like surface antigen